MAERLTRCQKCKSVDLETLVLVNPETTDMNCKALLRCRDCSHVWEDRVASPHYEKMRREGWII